MNLLIHSQNFIHRAVTLSKREIEMPYRIANFFRAADGRSVKREFDECAAECHLVAVFCDDNSFRERVKIWALEAKKRRIITSFIYIAANEVKKENDLLDIILKAYEGIDLCYSEDEDDDDEEETKQILEDLGMNLEKEVDENESDVMECGQKIAVGTLIFNPPDQKTMAEICEKWNYALGNSNIVF